MEATATHPAVAQAMGLLVGLVVPAAAAAAAASPQAAVLLQGAAAVAALDLPVRAGAAVSRSRAVAVPIRW